MYSCANILDRPHVYHMNEAALKSGMLDFSATKFVGGIHCVENDDCVVGYPDLKPVQYFWAVEQTSP